MHIPALVISHTCEGQADKLLSTLWVCCEFAKKNLELVDSILCQSSQSCWSTQEQKAWIAFLGPMALVHPRSATVGPVQLIFLMESHAFRFYLHYGICSRFQNTQPEESGSFTFLFMSYHLNWSQVHTNMCQKEPGGIKSCVLAGEGDCDGFTSFALPFPPPCPFPSANLLCLPFPWQHPFSSSSSCHCQCSQPCLGLAMPFYNRGAVGAKMLQRFWGCQPNKHYKHHGFGRRGRKMRYFFSAAGAWAADGTIFIWFIDLIFVNTWIVYCAYEIRM